MSLHPLQKKPTLAKWPFYLSNVFLVSIAIFLAIQTKGHLSVGSILVLIGSVLAGSILFIYPFVQEFKTYAKIQQSQNTGLGKDQLGRIELMLRHMQEMKEAVGQMTQKQLLNQNIASSTLQNIEARISDMAQASPSIISENVPSATHVQEVLDGMSLILSSIDRKLSKIQGGQEDSEEKQVIDKKVTINASFSPVEFSIHKTHAPSDSLETADVMLEKEIPSGSMDLYNQNDKESLIKNFFRQELPSQVKKEIEIFEDIEHIDTQIDQDILFDGMDWNNQLDSVSQNTIQNAAPQNTQALAENTLSDCATSLVQSKNMTQDDSLNQSNYQQKKAQGTSLVIKASLGLGKKPYVRGQGPGLSWNHGTPMEFIETGKWRWTATDSSQPVICRVYKNDESPADGEVLCLQPGEELEVAPVFK